MYPILFIDLLKQSSYKTTILLSVIHKQRTYFSKKYSKYTRITLSEPNKLSVIQTKDNIKAIKYANKTINLVKYIGMMWKCAYIGNIKITRYLLKLGFDIEYTFSIKVEPPEFYMQILRRNLLTHCSLNCNFKIIKLLLDKDANIHFDDDVALCLSAKSGKTNVVKYLLKKGANANAFLGYPLRWSANNGHKAIVKLLLDNCMIEQRYKNTALQWSIDEEHIDIVELLLEYSANIFTIEKTNMRISPKMRLFIEEKLKLI